MCFLFIFCLNLEFCFSIFCLSVSFYPHLSITWTICPCYKNRQAITFPCVTVRPAGDGKDHDCHNHQRLNQYSRCHCHSSCHIKLKYEIKLIKDKKWEIFFKYFYVCEPCLWTYLCPRSHVRFCNATHYINMEKLGILGVHYIVSDF